MTAFDWIIPLASFVVAAVGGLLLRRSGRKAAEQDAIQEDVENAKRIRDRADEARADTDKRPAVDRLRDDHPGSLRD